MERILGHRIIIDLGTKKVAGYTDIDFKLTPEFQESLIKEDEGVPVEEPTTRVDIEFTVNGLHFITEAGDVATHQDIEALRATTKAGTSVAFVYGRSGAGAPTVTGNCKITAFNEKSGAKGYGNWSITCRKVGTHGFGTRAS